VPSLSYEMGPPRSVARRSRRKARVLVSHRSVNEKRALLNNLEGLDRLPNNLNVRLSHSHGRHVITCAAHNTVTGMATDQSEVDVKALLHLMVVGRARGRRAVNMGLYALYSDPGDTPRVYRRVEAPHKFLFRDALHHWRIASDREDYAAVRLPVGVLRSEGRGPYITDVINGRSRWMFRNAIGKGFTLDPNIIVQCSRAWATANNERRLPPHKHTGRYVRRARRVLPLSAPPRGYLRHATTVSPRRPPAARALAVRA